MAVLEAAPWLPIVLIVLGIVMFNMRGKKPPPNTGLTPHQREIASQLGNVLTSAANPLAPLPDMSAEASRLIHAAIETAGSEFGQQYRIVTGKDFTHATLLGLGYLSMIKHLGLLVDILRRDPTAEFAEDSDTRQVAVAGVAPNWDDFFAGSVQSLASLDMMFRVVAIALDSADSRTERTDSGAWFDAASVQLERITTLAAKL